MLTPQLKVTGVKAKLSRTTSGMAEARAIKEACDKAISRAGMLKELALKQKKIIEGLIRQHKAGWINHPPNVPGGGSILVAVDDGGQIFGLDGEPVKRVDRMQQPQRVSDAVFAAFIRGPEGEVLNMYLDNSNPTGKLTVGIGHLIGNGRSAQAAVDFHQRVPFHDKDTGQPASDSQVLAEATEIFDKYESLKSGGGTAFAPVTRLRISNNQMESLYTSDIASHVRQIFGSASDMKIPESEFDTYPAGAQIAMADLAFNLGGDGFKTKFPDFHKAAYRRDWQVAADESSRSGPGADRNKDVKNKLLEAALEEPFFLSADDRTRKIITMTGKLKPLKPF